MVFASIQRHRRKTAAALLYIISMQQLMPCLALAKMEGGIHSPAAKEIRGSGRADSKTAGTHADSQAEGIGLQMGVSPRATVRPRSRSAGAGLKKYGPGPGQPEQQSFQSVGTSNMVDLFSGDFSYNIPLLDVGGYPINIHYRSGVSMDQEASWVGLGWNINPGSINRNMRGIPDDFKGDIITKVQSVRPNWTAGVNLGLDPEFFGLPAGLNASAGLFYNNYRGVGFETGAGIDISLTSAKGAKGGLDASLGLNLSNNSQNGFSIEPSFNLNRTRMEDQVSGISNGLSIGASFSTRRGLQDLNFSMSGSRLNKNQADDSRWNRSGPSTFGGNISFAHQAYTPTVHLPYTSYQFNFTFKLGGEANGFHPLGSIGGYYSRQYIAQNDTLLNTPAYGYMCLQNGNANPSAMLDFNREKELPAYSGNPPTPHLAIPNYTYDIYSISGEGTGGMFRPYRGDIGYVRDPVMRSKSVSGGGSADLGAGDVWHGGIDARFSYSTTTTGAWADNNQLAAQTGFKNADSIFENVYFRNPAEKAINAQPYYDKIGDTKVLMPVMTSYDDPSLTPLMQAYSKFIASGAPLHFDGSIVKTARDKRSQVISYLTAKDAANFGLETGIFNYPYNQFIPTNCGLSSGVVTESRVSSYRKPHHFSEITVLNPDGKRYIYGLPVYNLDQEEVSFSVDKNHSNAAAGGNLVQYQPGTNSSLNNSGKDHFYSREKIPAYASSFLITGLVSSDYVDRTGDGITDDDQGDAVKFDYTKLYGTDNPYKWRTPYALDSATYQEGLKTDNSDDKGSYIYGTKEIWYLNSLVTKTMIATFTLNDPAKGEVRQDGYGVVDENGGMDPSHGLRYLKQIDLYSKVDYFNFINKGTTPTPVKTVHFVYSYRLCPGAPGSLNGQGKLTLDSIWYSYNGNNKGHQNPYVFHYHTNNPSYNNSAYDRWGNYKHPSSNPGGISNADYPYSLQNGINGWDSTQAAYNAGAWNLDSIRLPSTGTLKIAYESDDYAYVQNKRAMEMMQIAGFGPDNSFTGETHLFDGVSHDYPYVFIHVPNGAASRQDVYNQYLAGTDKIYFTYSVKMPADLYGSGYEHVAVYAQYDDYGVSSSDNQLIWIHMKSAEGGSKFVSPLAKAAIQFLRLNLPSKAYPGSDLNGEYDPVALGKSLVGYIVNFGELISNFATRCRILGNASLIDPSHSFARLNNPVYKKFGGGLRVKRITLSDNFLAMTGQKASVYGQEYDYTTFQTINGVSTRISSGVAAWEPSIGNEENPFRVPIEYTTQVSPLAPSSNMYSEYPLGEGYFPGAQVGYSKVRIHTINSKVSSANGFEETEFYTAYDFPTLTEQTPLDTRTFKSSFLAKLFKINARSYLAQSQGFQVEINDMNGKEKATASYPENDPYNPLSYTKYYYRTDNDSAVFKHLSNTVMVVDSASGHISPSAQIGKDIELMVDLREENTKTKGIDVEFNVDGFILGIFPLAIPMVWPFPQWETDRYRSAATMKLVQRWGILNKVLHYERGSLITTEDLAYDAETGEPLLTRTQNEFNDPVYQFTYPAHWAYSGMEPAYKNIGAVFSNVWFTNGRINAGNYPNIEKYFESGDEIMVTNVYNKTGSTPNINECTGEGSCASPLFSGTANILKLWAIDAGKIQNNKGLTGIYFIDQWGNFFNSQPAIVFPFQVTGANIQILRSGKRNMAGMPVGSVQSLSNPLRQVNGTSKLVFDDQTRVVNTSAAAMNEFWKVQDAKFVLSTTIVSKTPALKTAYILPAASNAAITISYEGYSCCRQNYVYTNRPYFEAGQRDGGRGSADMAVSSWLKLSIPNAPQFSGDTNYIPPGATVTNAWLYLRPHLDTHNENDGSMSEKFHAAGAPHANGDASFLLQRITDPAFNSINFSALTNSNTTLINSIKAMAVDNSSVVAVNKTAKQNSIELNVTSMIQGMVQNPSQPTALKLTPAASYHLNSRLCFWSASTCNAASCQTATEPGGFIGPNAYFYCPGHGNPCPTSPYIKVNYLFCENGSQQVTICDTQYCIKTSAIDTCLSNITDTTLNPYRFGVLGNWRQARSYIYYDNRKEVDPTQPTDIRNNGTITGFVPYWSFTTGKLAPATDTVKWVWNMESTLFNKRGLELENHNALDIYNSAQYGYNQSLPVAVTQNAAYKEQAFEGFEDYGFPAGQNCNRCIVPRHITIDSTATNITTAEAHTGKYSLFIGPGHIASAISPVTQGPDSAGVLSMKLDTTNIPIYVITPSGGGLADTFYKFNSSVPYLADTYGLDNFNYSQGPLSFTSTTVPGSAAGTVNYNSATYPSNYRTYYKMVWQGALMSDVDIPAVQFRVSATNSFKMWINNTLVIDAFANDPTIYNGSGNSYAYSTGVYTFRRSKIYTIRIEHEAGNQTGEVQLSWNPGGSSTYSLLPRTYLYPSVASAQAAIRSTNTQCVNWNGISGTNLLYHELAPKTGSQMLISAWVKEQQDCHCNSYTHGSIRVYFRDKTGNGLGYAASGTAYPTGNIIEGWQRIETYVTLPANAASMQVMLENNNADGYSGLVYFDDLRIHPFNGEMKSYIYDDVNLRLMAQLDENNYASFYEYDDDGTLVRVKKETEQGIKTIKETRGALVKDIP
ncbi:MAG TPA: hypothetical protein VNS58_02695 [Puia sp.]|nr:hypothetical protein [Puia sp.]